MLWCCLGFDLQRAALRASLCPAGRKWDTKLYRWHTGYPGGLKERTAKEMFAKKPDSILREAVLGMLPKNNLRRVSRAGIIKDRPRRGSLSCLAAASGMAFYQKACIPQLDGALPLPSPFLALALSFPSRQAGSLKGVGRCISSPSGLEEDCYLPGQLGCLGMQCAGACPRRLCCRVSCCWLGCCQRLCSLLSTPATHAPCASPVDVVHDAQAADIPG